MRWPKGPPHLALNPPYLFVFVFVFVFFVPFLSLLLIENPCFPPKKGIFCLFSVFLFLSPSTFFDLPLFLFLFLCLSLSLSCSCLSFFLLVFLFCFLFVSCFCLFFIFFFLLCFCFLKRTTWKFKLQFLFFHQFFLFFMVSCLVFPFKSLFLIFFFLILSYVFCSTWMFLVSKQTTKKKLFFVKRGVATKRFFFLQPVFCKMWKVIVFFAPFLPNFGWCSKTL